MSIIRKYIKLLFRKYKPNVFSQKIKFLFKDNFLYTKLENETNFLDVNCTISERIFYILNDLKKPIVCKNCGGKVPFKSIFKGYKVFCSKECYINYGGQSKIASEWWQSLDNSNKLKYITYYKKCFRNSYIINYGMNVDNNNYIPELIKKRNRTLIKKYGTIYPSKTKDIQEKIKRTCIDRYGVKSVFSKGSIIREKINKNNLEKYGNEYPICNLIIRKKAFDSNYKNKEYIFKNGDIVKTQGYAPKLLQYLEVNGICREDIKVEWECVIFDYFYNGKNRKYIPDIILFDKVVIEVKSDYTLFNDNSFDMNIAKANKVISDGYMFLFVVYYRKNAIVFVLNNIGYDISLFNNGFKVVYLENINNIKDFNE